MLLGIKRRYSKHGPEYFLLRERAGVIDVGNEGQRQAVAFGVLKRASKTEVLHES